MNASAFTGRATLKGGSGDDTLIGGSGGDYLYGESGNDSLKGSSGSDRLYGGDGHDNLYGQGGTDRLYGGNGVDGLYGGNGADYLTGGSGSDRFLHQDGDTINDHKRSQDARIDFENGGRDTSRERNLFAGAWTQDEIELVDQALGDLHMQTMDDTLLETSAGNRMHFRRHGRGNVLGLHNGAQRILFTNGAFSNDDLLRRTVFHEIGHNWEREHGDFSSWRALSGWTSGGRNNPALQDSLDGNWRHRRNANFVSDYAKNNPFDDFADTFAAIFADKRGDTFEADLGFSSPANVLDIADLNGKRNHINNWLDDLTS